MPITGILDTLELTTPYEKYGNRQWSKELPFYPMSVSCNASPDQIKRWLVVTLDQNTDRHTKILEYVKKQMVQKIGNDIVFTSSPIFKDIGIDTIFRDTGIGIKDILIPLSRETTAKFLRRNENKELCWVDGNFFDGGEEFSASISFKLSIKYSLFHNTIYIHTIHVLSGTILDSSIRWETDCVFPDYLYNEHEELDMNLINRYLLDYSCVA